MTDLEVRTILGNFHEYTHIIICFRRHWLNVNVFPKDHSLDKYSIIPRANIEVLHCLRLSEPMARSYNTREHLKNHKMIID